MGFYVYILDCADRSYYTGHTDNLDKRLAEHIAGQDPTCYTFKRRPLRLVFTEPVATREEALAFERRVKGWRRAKKAALIRGDWQEMSKLARSYCKTFRPE